MVPAPSQEFTANFSRLQDILRAVVTQAIAQPFCSQAWSELVHDRYCHCRVVVVFFTSRKERQSKLKESYPRHQKLIDQIIKVFPRTPGSTLVVQILEEMQKEFKEFGWSLVVEGVPKQEQETTPCVVAEKPAPERKMQFRNSIPHPYKK
ncbi:MAG: hypothetical protein KW802_03375 [Candidatus Doudnabacteria bacterium]|nr:hypothetical protein [Candidatus Doudnabacteria bacterium]